MRRILALIASAWMCAHGAQLTVGVGNAGNDGTGDGLRTAFQKVNSNFSALFEAVFTNSVTDYNSNQFTVSGQAVSILSGATVTNLVSSGTVTLGGVEYTMPSAPSGVGLLSTDALGAWSWNLADSYSIGLLTNTTAELWRIALDISTNDVGSLGTQESNSVAITGGTISGISDLAVADGGSGASSAISAARNLQTPHYLDLADFGSLTGSESPAMLVTTNASYSGDWAFVPDTETLPPWADFRLDGSSDYTGYAYRNSGDNGYFIRRWFDRVINALEHGVKGDGVTDDTAAIQAILEFAYIDDYDADWSRYSVGIVFPPGTYWMDGTVEFDKSGDGAERNHNRISLVGTPWQTWFATDRTDGSAMFYAREVSFLSGYGLSFRGRNGSSPAVRSTAPFTDGTGIFLWDCIEGEWEHLFFYGLGAGMKIYNRSGGGMQVDAMAKKMGIGWLGDGVQTSDFNMHINTSGTAAFFNGASGSHFRMRLIESADNDWGQLESGFRLTGGSSMTVDLGYTENNNYDLEILSLGTEQVFTSTNVSWDGSYLTIPLGQWNTLRQDGDNTNGLGQVTISVGSTNSDLAAIDGQEFTLLARTNAIFASDIMIDPGITVTSTLAGVEFTIRDTSDTLEIDGVTLKGPRADITFRAALDHVNGLMTTGGAINTTNLMAHWSTTTNCWNVDLRKIVASNRALTYWNSSLWKRPNNRWPDPEFLAGTNQFSYSGTWRYRGTAEYSTEHSFDRGGSLKVVPKVLSGETVMANGWVKLTIPGLTSADVGKYCRVSCSVLAPDTEAYRPATISVTAAGSGYSNGDATITLGDQTVTVTLTTSGGNITAAAWKYGYFETGDTSTALAVTQSGGSGGQLTVATYIDDGFGVGNNPNYTIRLQNQSSVDFCDVDAPITKKRENADKAGRWYHHFGYGVVPAGTTSVRLYVNIYGIGSKVSGAEAIYIDDLMISLSDDDPNNRQYDMLGIDAMPGEAGLIKYSEGTPEGGLSGAVGDIAVDTVNGAAYLKQSGNRTTTGWDLITTRGNADTLARTINPTQVKSKTLTDRVTNGTFTGTATGWGTAGGWTYGTNDVYITGGVIVGAALSQSFTDIHSGSEYTVAADLGGFAANEEVVVTFAAGSSTVTLGTYAAPGSISEALTIPEIGTSSSGTLTFTLSNSSGTAATYVDNVTMTLTREMLRQSPIATYWPAASLAQVGDGGRAVWRGGIDANTPQLDLIMVDSAGNESSLWTWTAPASGDFELTADFIYLTTAAGRWSVRMLQHQQDIAIDQGTFVNVTWASEGAQLLLEATPDADDDVRIDWAEYQTTKTP